MIGYIEDRWLVVETGQKFRARRVAGLGQLAALALSLLFAAESFAGIETAARQGG